MREVKGYLLKKMSQVNKEFFFTKSHRVLKRNLGEQDTSQAYKARKNTKSQGMM